MDLQKFMSAQATARETDVPVPELSSFFEKGKKRVWRVRGLTGIELGRCRECRDRHETVAAMVKAIAGEGDKASELQKALGLADGEVPKDVSERIEVLAIGSVDPVIGDERRDVILRLVELYPVTFYTLTNKIQNLTGAGAELGKPKSSGKTRKSG